MRTSTENFQTKIVEAGGNTYICKSRLGIAEATPNWGIVKIDASGNKSFPLDSKGFPTDELIFSVVDPTIYTYSYTYVQPE